MPMATVVAMNPVVRITSIGIRAVSPPPAVARIGIARTVVLAIRIRIELGAPAWIGDDVLGRCRIGRQRQE